MGMVATLCVHEAGPAGAPKPRLLDRVRAAIRARHYSLRTEKAYVHWIRRYIFFHGDVVRAKRPKYLPVVLTRDEVRAVLQQLDGVARLMAILPYGAGLRLLECCRLRVRDVEALDAIGAVLNRLEQHFRQSTVVFEGFEHPGDAEVLLYVIRDGLEAEHARRKRLHDGKPAPGDFDSRPV